ncbi:MAG: Ig-like domain-containing protein, partial [Micrococcales bacterium]|nr:Ig-like domain-containing protein [Micrococcales bacterium]
PFEGEARPQPAAADEVSLYGPLTGGRGEALTYNVQPTGAYAGTVVLSDGGAGGSFSASVLTWTGESTAKTFTYTPSGGGVVTLVATASLNTYLGADVVIPVEALELAVPALTYSITTSATEAPVGVPITYTVTPDGVYTGTILLMPMFGDADIDPMVVSFARGETSKTITYTARAAGENGVIGLSLAPSLIDDIALITTWATDIVISGPAFMGLGSSSAGFFVTADGPWPGGDVVVSQAPENGTLLPSDGVVSLVAGDSPSSGFGWKPDRAGRTVLSATAPGVSGSMTVITPATGYELVFATDVFEVGKPVALEIIPNGPWEGSIALFATNATISPNYVTFTYADTSITVMVTPTAVGPINVTATSISTLGTDPELGGVAEASKPSPSPSTSAPTTPGGAPTTAKPPAPPAPKPPAPPAPKPPAPPTPKPPAPPADPTASMVRAAVTKINVQAGKAAKVTLIADPGPGQAGATSITVKSSNPNAVTATFPGGSVPVAGESTGKVGLGAAVVLNLKAAKKPGKAAVAVTIGGKSVSIAVTVVAKAVKTDKATIKGKKKMKVGTTMLLKAGAAPAKATGAVPKWKSSKKKFASVDATGLVTALAPGKTVITATVNGKKATLAITITK